MSLAARATRWDDPGHPGGSPGPGPAARALSGARGGLTRAASDRPRRLSRSACALRRGHAPWGTAGRVGGRSVASDQTNTCGRPSKPSCIPSGSRSRLQRPAPRRRAPWWQAPGRSPPWIEDGASARTSSNSGGRRSNRSDTLRGSPPTRPSTPCTPRGSRSPRLPHSSASAVPRSLRTCDAPPRRVHGVPSGQARCCGRLWRIWSSAGGRGARTACRVSGSKLFRLQTKHA